MKTLREALKNKKVIIGADRTLKNLKLNKLKRVYLASNVRKDIEEDIEHHTKLFNIKLVKLKENNEELGLICKKHFKVSVLSF